jgi:hypothetical protein
MTRRFLGVLVSLVIAGTLGLASAAHAQEAPPPAGERPHLTVHGGLHLPLGDFADAANPAIGAIVRYNIPVAQRLVVTAGGGILFHFPKTIDLGIAEVDLSLIQIPILGGVRYALSPSASYPYVAAELGINIIRVSASLDGESDSDTETDLAMLLGGGYVFGRLDLRGGLMISNLDEAGDSLGLVAMLGYQF